MKEKLIIVGTGPTAKRVYRFVEMYRLYDIIGFAVDRAYKTTEEFMGLPVYDLEALKEVVEANDALVFVALFWNNLNKDRKEIYDRLNRKGYKFANIISPNAVVRGTIKGNNCWINDFVVIQSDAVLENDIFIMDMSLIGNETVIHSHSFIVSAKVGGGSSIGEQCFIGINAVVFDDTTVGNKCIIGACTTIKRNVNDNTVCKMVADNTIKKEYSDNVIESKLKTNHNVR
ncbi:MAG: transferase [Clostridia bacterium]|nr:transferase [Clostridia bacterium]